MRIVVSGTHASGKSTLISDFIAAHPDYVALGDPFDLVDENQGADAELFDKQLRLAARRLITTTGSSLIVERGPWDFLAYLDALDTLGRDEYAAQLFQSGLALTLRASARADLVAFLPVDEHIPAPLDEEGELREAMEAALRDLLEDGDIVTTPVVELTGSPSARLAQLQQAIRQHV